MLREGIFRISGVKTEIDTLKACFESGVEASCYEAVQKADIDAVTGVLKQYFRELPEPLFTYTNFGKFVKSGVEKNLAGIKGALQTLPQGHKETILFMLGFLLKVTEYQDLNKMTETNVGIVFVPTLMRSPSDDENDEPESLKEAFFFMLQNANSLLKDEPKVNNLLQTYMAENTCGGGSGGGATRASSMSSNLPPTIPPSSIATLPPPAPFAGLPPPITQLPPSIANLPPPMF